eukprot:c8442_g2_i2.p1 GENE.c8442_g2_i2~~c8442_g2_i2.p1  ORF type:complete len:711 (+),score=143.83 c8442_g2_i2:224-2356(+)
MGWEKLFTCVLAFEFCHASKILSPANLTQFTFPTPLLHDHIGTKLGANKSIVAKLSFGTSLDTCGNTNTLSLVNGTIFLLDVVEDYHISLMNQQEQMLCAQDAGAVAVIVNYHDILVPGFTLYFNQGIKNKLSIPALNTADTDLAHIIVALKAGQAITTALQEDVNEWKVLWESKSFFVVWWVVLPIINVFGLCNGLFSLSTHIHFGKRSTQEFTNNPHARLALETNKRLMVFGCVFEILGFIFRLSYCLTSPLYSNLNLTYAGQVFLINLSLPQEISAALICTTCLFLRWGAFGKFRRENIIERAMQFVAIIVSSPLQIFVAMLGYFHLTSGFFVVVFSGLLLIIAFATCIVFIFYGMYFISRLGHRVGDESKLSAQRERALATAVRWIMLSGVMQVLVLMAICLALDVPFFFRPFGFNVAYTLLYIGSSLQGSIQVVAFRRPISSKLTVTTISGATRQSVATAMRVIRRVSTTPSDISAGSPRTANVSKPRVIMPTLQTTQSDTTLSRKRENKPHPARPPLKLQPFPENNKVANPYDEDEVVDVSEQAGGTPSDSGAMIATKTIPEQTQSYRDASIDSGHHHQDEPRHHHDHDESHAHHHNHTNEPHLHHTQPPHAQHYHHHESQQQFQSPKQQHHQQQQHQKHQCQQHHLQQCHHQQQRPPQHHNANHLQITATTATGITITWILTMAILLAATPFACPLGLGQSSG